MANNMKKMLADQQKINEAVKAIFNYFRDCPYASYVEQLADAQTQIIALMELAKQQAAIRGACEEVQTDGITTFLMDASYQLKLLRPFAELLGDYPEDE